MNLLPFVFALLTICPVHFEEWDAPFCDDGNPLNGYWWEGEAWVPGLVDNATWFMPTPIVFEGKAVWYAPQVMEATAASRGLSLEGYAGGVSGTSCADVGLTYWVGQEAEWGARFWRGPFLVVDCASRGDLYGVVVSRDEAVELSWDLKEAFEFDNPERVIVSKVPPILAEGYEPVRLEEVFLEAATFYPRSVTGGPMEPQPIYLSPFYWKLNGAWKMATPFGLVQVP